MMYRVEVITNPGSSFKIKSKDYEFVVDTQGGGVTPPDTLLASVASCLGVYIRKYLDNSKIKAGDFSIIAEAEFTAETPHRFQNIKVHVDLKDTPLDERRKMALLEFIKNCPVHNTLKANPTVDIEIQ